MKKMQMVLMAMLMSAGLFAQRTINDPNVEPRNLSGFHAIKISNAFEVFISQGNEDGVAISASKAEYREKIITRVENGVLIVRFDDDKKFWKNWSGDKTRLKAYISVKTLDKLSVSGACDVFFEEGVSAEELVIDLSGASDLKGRVETKKLTIDISGASDATISGNAATLNVGASGASDFKAFDLVTNYCDARATGASSVNITVNKELSASASGASSVRFKGEGLIRDIKTSGSSNVSRKS
ncbi:MAG TPA: head GIN domain-containing protein [Chitinophagaceae bacterium]|nr:head GIN domain-containing protein [Chitinophagaceae bacterium]